MKITVIVPSFNQGRFLDEMIRSTVTQTWEDSDSSLELIIIDGGSTDETLDVIRRYASSIAYWISERDGGQADAINKGLRKATGDVVTWFGADDVYVDGIFDYDYLAPALQRFPVEYVDHLAAGFRLHRRSKTISQTEQMMAETAAVSQRYWSLVGDVDGEGFERSEHEARVRRAVSQLVRGRRSGLSLLWQTLRERPLAAVARLALLGPIVLSERIRRMLPTRYF